MPLEIIELRDLRTFVQSYVSTILARDLPGKSLVDDLTTGYNMGFGDGRDLGGGRWSVYMHLRDQTFYNNISIKVNPVGPLDAIKANIHARDALCRNASVGFHREGDTLLSGLGSHSASRVKVGQPNLQTGQQKLYWYKTGASFEHLEISSVNGEILTTDVWPNMPANDFLGVGAGTPAVNGEWGNDADDVWNPIIFEGMTDTSGYNQETSSSAGMLSGVTSHPEGLALTLVRQVRLNGTLYGRRWCWIDLDTGNAVGVLGLPVRADTGSANTFGEASIDGVNFDWGAGQFVPDEDSTFSQPKGEIHFHSSESNAFERSGQTVTAPDGSSFTSLVTRNYVVAHDFNPFGVQTGTVRVHNRRTFTGIVDIPQEPIIASGFNATDGSTNYQERSIQLIYHPPSRSYICVTSHPENANRDGTDSPAVGHSRIVRFRRSVVNEFISKPTPTSEVQENRTVRFRTLVNTDLGEPSVGATVSFSYYRNSTRAESFDGTATGAGTYTVEADEIDEDGTLDVREGNDVDNGGTLLVETTDYTVNYGTGVLTPVGSWPSDTIYVRYRHRNVNLTPGHGTLLSASSVTDANGQAFASIRYGDNVDGELDGVEATV